MSDKKYWWGFWAIVVAGLVLRLFSLAPFGFYCDVPQQLKAMSVNSFLLYFPGYLPYQLIVKGLGHWGFENFEGMWGISLACGLVSMIYVALAARKEVGEEFSLLAAAVMAFGILPVYFSVVGASYPTDMLCVAGMLFHGWEYLQTRKRRSYYFALAWLCFGVMMRPLSAGFCCAGLAVLLWSTRDWRAATVTVLALALTVAAFITISVPYYGSLDAMRKASSVLSESLELMDWKRKIYNVGRLGLFPIYGFHVWLLFSIWVALKNWKVKKWRQLLFLVAVSGPYFLLLIRYIPHAGYYCLLIPAIVLLPACFLSPSPTGCPRLYVRVAAAFVAIAACQWFLVRPMPITSLKIGAADVYVLDYSRSGIKQGMFENLSYIMYKYNFNTNAISESRLNAFREGGH